MIVSELFEGVLIERRPDMVSELSKYATDPDIYITFVDFQKVGINPQSDFSTPVGIYTYPVQAYWNVIQYGNIPYAADRPYVYVLKAVGKVLELSDYGKADYEQDLVKLRRLHGQAIVDHMWRKSEFDENPEVSAEDIWQKFIDYTVNHARVINTVTNPFGFALWQITMAMAAILPGNTPVTWNALFRALGYTGVSDKEGQGIIHPNEPTQAVFFSKQAIRTVEMLHNIRKVPHETFGDYPIKLDKIDDLTEIMFYDDPTEGGHSEKYRFLMKEWPEILMTGKSPHFETNNFEEFVASFNPDPGPYSGLRDGLQGFVYEIRRERGALTNLLLLSQKFPDDMWPGFMAELPDILKDATLTRSDIKRLLEPNMFDRALEAGVNPAEMIVRWAIRPIHEYNNSRLMTVHDVLSKIGSSAKQILKLVPHHKIQQMIDQAYEDNIPF